MYSTFFSLVYRAEYTYMEISKYLLSVEYDSSVVNILILNAVVDQKRILCLLQIHGLLLIGERKYLMLI